MSNLALWNAVVATDPNYTKSFSRGGGFKGTAINFVYLARKATEQFGPIGLGWGANVIDEDYQDGAWLDDKNREVIHVVRIKLWYVTKDGRGEIESFGQTTFVGKNKNGPYTDEEAPKKSLTDAMSKALSWLGFGADVHLGLFDDNKYVADRKQEFGEGKEAVVTEAVPQIGEATVKSWQVAIAAATTLDALRITKEECMKECKATGSADAWAVLRKDIEARAAALKVAA